MILLLKHDATDAAVRELTDRVAELGLSTAPLDGGRGRALEVVGDDPSRVLGLRGLAAVEEVLTRRTPLKGGEPVWPHFTLRVIMLALGLLVTLALLSGFLPPGLGDRTKGLVPSGPPEWYLRPLFGLLNLVGPAFTRVLAGLFWVLFFAWPFLDRTETPKGRLLIRAMGIALLALLVALGVQG
jgi:hypothetical protein